MGQYSGILFAEPSFVGGVARMFDFGHTLAEYNRSLTEQQADALAMLADWRAIGADMRRATDQFGNSIPEDR